MTILSRRIGEIAALATIGDGMMGLLRPREHVSLWRGGPGWWDRMIAYFEERPGLTRAAGAGGLVFGIWLAARMERESKAEAT